MEIAFPTVFLLRLHAKNCFPALFYIICGSTTERSFTPILHRVLASALWPFVLVENYHLKFYHLKPIP